MRFERVNDAELSESFERNRLLVHAKRCRSPIEKGQLRACRAGLINQRWYHVECVEGGLAPSEAVVGLGDLDDEMRERALAVCNPEPRDRPQCSQ